QAEDGIRDSSVTGVQTCALPISPGGADLVAAEYTQRAPSPRAGENGRQGTEPPGNDTGQGAPGPGRPTTQTHRPSDPLPPLPGEIGRASCRERGEHAGDAAPRMK